MKCQHIKGKILKLYCFKHFKKKLKTLVREKIGSNKSVNYMTISDTLFDLVTSRFILKNSY